MRKTVIYCDKCGLEIKDRRSAETAECSAVCQKRSTGTDEADQKEVIVLIQLEIR